MLARTVLAIRPVAFHANPQTRASNAFQRDATLAPAAAQAAALAEAEGLHAALRAAGVEVVVFDDTPTPPTPDAIFPNNWVSFHEDGRVVLYPMQAENRRAERRPELLERLALDHGFRVGVVLDASPHERAGRYLEGTGSLVLDRARRLAFACWSPRTDARVLADVTSRLGYTPVTFHAVGPDGTPLYHTNVMLAVGNGFAVVCEDAVPDPAERAALRQALAGEVVPITMDQLASFAGNMLALAAADGHQVLVMSRRAEASLRPDQRAALSRHATLVAAPLDTIEDLAGGSARCMLAEVFLPR